MTTHGGARAIFARGAKTSRRLFSDARLRRCRLVSSRRRRPVVVVVVVVVVVHVR